MEGEIVRPSAGGGAVDELVPVGAIASIELRMEARKSESARCGSTSSWSGDGGVRCG